MSGPGSEGMSCQLLVSRARSGNPDLPEALCACGSV